MIIDLPATSTTAISKKLVALRNQVGAMALGRVLTLVIPVDDRNAEAAIEVANEASRQHPCRIIVVVAGDRRGANRLDAQIRLGGDAGASEIVALRLYGPLAGHGPSVVVPLLLADSPIVAWWPADAPADVAKDPIGRMAQRRITDAAEGSNPRALLKARAATYRAGDTDLSWTRVTKWRGLLAAALDQAPYEPITAAVVAGAPDSPSTDLLAGWLANRLRCPVQRVATPKGSGICSVRLDRRSGPIDLVRPGDSIATLSQSGQPDRRITLPRRELPECLADELRRLDEDDTYAATLLHGVPALRPTRVSAAVAEAAGTAPSVAAAKRLATKLGRDANAREAAEMIEGPTPPPTDDPATVKKATARKLADRPTPREKQVRATKATTAKASAPKASPAKASPAKASPAKASPAKVGAAKAGKSRGR